MPIRRDGWPLRLVVILLGIAVIVIAMTQVLGVVIVVGASVLIGIITAFKGHFLGEGAPSKAPAPRKPGVFPKPRRVGDFENKPFSGFRGGNHAPQGNNVNLAGPRSPAATSRAHSFDGRAARRR